MKKITLLLFVFWIGSVAVKASAVPVNSGLTTAFSSDERTVKDFEGVVAGGPLEVIVKFGEQESLRFEGDADAILTLVSEVKGKLLIIRPKTSWVSWAHKYRDKKITAYVTAKQLTSLSMSGNGKVSVVGTVVAAEFAATLSGSGSITARVEADKLTGVLSGSGNSDITGQATVADVTLSGPGKFGSKQLIIKEELSARISGAGSIQIRTNGKINAIISGSGHVYFVGTPEIEQRVIGAGGVAELK